MTVVYRLEGSALSIEYEAVSDADTVLNLTNHAYFNLSGEGEGTIEDHILILHADAYTAIDGNGLTVEKVIPVAGTPFDFRSPKAIVRTSGRTTSSSTTAAGTTITSSSTRRGVLKRLPKRSPRRPASG